jgi:hypothetical protein
MRRLAHLLAVVLVANVVNTAALQEDACARFSSAEASTVLGATVAQGRATVRDLATECSYETTGSKSPRMTISVYETGRAGLRGSAAGYFAEVRRASMHMRLPIRPVDVGDEAYWMGGVLHVRHGQDLALAIEVVGTKAAGPDESLALSTKVATIILARLGPSSTPRETLTIATNTQAHLEGLRLAVGNIWEETFTAERGATRTGLTAMLEVGVPQDASRRQRVRVHPGQTLRLFGYMIQVLSVERSRVQLTLELQSHEQAR